MTEVHHGVETKKGTCPLCNEKDVKLRKVELTRWKTRQPNITVFDIYSPKPPTEVWLCLMCITDVSKAKKGYK